MTLLGAVEYRDDQRVAALESEDDTPLIIDPDLVLAFAPALRRFQSVAGWHAKIIEIGGIVQVQDFAAGGSQKLRRKGARPSDRGADGPT